MKLKFKIGLTLGATVSLVAPLTSVACGNNHKKGLGIVSINDEPIDFSKSYSVEKLKAEALDINNGKPWGDQALWKNGFLYESVTQAVSMLTNVAEAFGYKQELSLNRDMGGKDSGWKSMLVIDGNKDDKNVSSEALLQNAGIEPSDTDYEHILEETNFLRSITVDNTPITDAMRRNSFSLAALNQTIDSTNDLSRFHLVSSVLKNGISDEERDLLGVTGFYSAFSWADSNKPKAVNVVYADRGSSARVAIKFKVDNVLGEYPVIEQSKFDARYAPYLKEAFNDFMKKIGSLLNGATSVYDVDMIKSILPRTVVDLFDFFLSSKIVTIDANGEYKTNFDDNQLMSIFHKLNANGSINWLAIKGFILGYDESFSTEGYEKWINSNWTTAIANNHNNPIGMVGLRDDSYNLAAMADATSGLTPWMHGGSFLFNPTLSIQDNYALDGSTFDPNKYPSIAKRKEDFNKLIDAFVEQSKNGLVLSGEHYVPKSKTFTQEQLIDLGIANLPTKDDVEYSDIKLVNYDENAADVTISMKARNIHITHEEQSRILEFKIKGFKSKVTADEAKTQLSVIKDFLTQNTFDIEKAFWGVNPFAGSEGYLGAGIFLKAGEKLDLANIKVVATAKDGISFNENDINLSKVGNALDDSQSKNLLDIFSMNKTPRIEDENTINKLDLELVVNGINPTTGLINFTVNIYPKGNSTVIDTSQLAIILPLVGD